MMKRNIVFRGAFVRPRGGWLATNGDWVVPIVIRPPGRGGDYTARVVADVADVADAPVAFGRTEDGAQDAMRALLLAQGRP